MKKLLGRLMSVLLLMVSIQGFCAGVAFKIHINDAIGPAIAEHTKRTIETANQGQARLIIIQMDTPGGLDYSMRTIIKSILTSSIPVVTYVSPGGSRAASAGTFILYASHVAAMAPGTNLGAASPVAINQKVNAIETGQKRETGSDEAEDISSKAKDLFASQKETLRQKALNDAAAYIKSLAELRGRNVEWAVKAVKEAATLSAEEAKAKNVIDLIAVNLDDLLKKLHGRTVKIGNQSIKIDSKDLQIQELPINWRTKLLMIITNPSIAYILLMLGMYGLFFEFFHPGTLVPGVVGAIALVTALYALQLLPINYAGLLLILLGIAFMVAENFMPSFGILGIGGVVAFLVGSLLLFDSTLPEFRVAIPVVLGMTLMNVAIFIFVISMAIRSHKRSVVVGRETVIGERGLTIEPLDGQGRVRVQGEIWTARSDEKLPAGSPIEVVDIQGIVLTVVSVKK